MVTLYVLVEADIRDRNGGILQECAVLDPKMAHSHKILHGHDKTYTPYDSSLFR